MPDAISRDAIRTEDALQRQGGPQLPRRLDQSRLSACSCNYPRMPQTLIAPHPTRGAPLTGRASQATCSSCAQSPYIHLASRRRVNNKRRESNHHDRPAALFSVLRALLGRSCPAGQGKRGATDPARAMGHRSAIGPSGESGSNIWGWSQKGGARPVLLSSSRRERG